LAKDHADYKYESVEGYPAKKCNRDFLDKLSQESVAGKKCFNLCRIEALLLACTTLTWMGITNDILLVMTWNLINQAVKCISIGY
jgi:hypothetical protein